MATAETIPDYRDALEGLARSIRKYRQDCPPHETARQLLEFDSPGHTALVGINHDVTRVAIYHESEAYVIAVNFGPDGLEDGGPIMAEFDGFGSNVYGWVSRMDAYWAWVNPRFR